MARIHLRDTIRAFSLAALSFACLPFSLLATCVALLLQASSSGRRLSRTVPAAAAAPGGSRRTILVTGVGMAKGLTLARAFHLAGHRVIGADFESWGIPCSGRFSRSLSAFYRLPKPGPNTGAAEYIQTLVHIARQEHVDLWVSCSGVASAVEDAEAKETLERVTACACVQFDVATTSTLHEKHSFMDRVESLGLPRPETHYTTSPADVLRILARSSRDPSLRFLLKPVGVDDVHRGDMTLLPLATDAATEAHVTALPIVPHRPWILQQFIAGGDEYCTHALVVAGQVRCFVACPSAELLMHYDALPHDSGLWRAMLAFTREFVARSPDPASLTGHLSFDFMVQDDEVDNNGMVRRIYPIECNPRTHTAVVLFSQPGPELDAMVRAYLSVLESQPMAKGQSSAVPSVNGTETELVIPPVTTIPRYWIGHDLVFMFLQSLVSFFQGQVSLRHAVTEMLSCISHLLLWKEGTFEAWDPLPALVLYHVYWPLHIMSAWWHGRRWSRVNVSTTKIFAC